jgi:hypothetical protein
MPRKIKSSASTKPETMIVTARVEIPAEDAATMTDDTDFFEYVVNNIDQLWAETTWDIERIK